MRDILKALNDFERDFERTHGVCLNEAAVLCSLKSGRLSASDIAAKVGLTPSHASKVIRSIERKGLVERVLGQQDRRQMYFDLTPCGRERLDGMRAAAWRFRSCSGPCSRSVAARRKRERDEKENGKIRLDADRRSLWGSRRIFLLPAGRMCGRELPDYFVALAEFGMGCGVRRLAGEYVQKKAERG